MRINRKNSILFLIYVIIPLGLGGVIYILKRPEHLVLFDWLEMLRLKSTAMVLRDDFSAITLWPQFIYNLPGSLWLFSFTSMQMIIWDGKLTKASIGYISLPLIVALGSEFGQLHAQVQGTFDPRDALYYIGSFIISITILKKKSVQ